MQGRIGEKGLGRVVQRVHERQCCGSGLFFSDLDPYPDPTFQ